MVFSVLSDSQGLTALTPSEFVNEGDFQQLLEKFPALLSGNQTDDVRPDPDRSRRASDPPTRSFYA
jgi:hypothetical protein